jgi:molecular chaperone GrpE
MTADRRRDTEIEQVAEVAPQRIETEPSPATPGDPEAQQREYDALHDKYLRLLAEFDNYKKLAARERQQYLQFGNEELLKEWLPILDNIERALRHAEEQQIADAVVKGWALIFRQCQDVLGKAGVTAVESLGRPFNPEWHQAIAQREATEVDEGTILEEAQRGYLIKGKLLRPALVVVAKPPAEAAGSAG